MRAVLAWFRWVLFAGSFFGSAFAFAGVCSTGEVAFTVTVQGVAGSGETQWAACKSALDNTGGSYVGGVATVTNGVCTITKADLTGTRTGTVSDAYCTPYAGSLYEVVAKLEQVRLAVVASGGGGGTVTAVISSEGVLNTNDAETRSLLIAACCVGIVALGFIGGNLS